MEFGLAGTSLVTSLVRRVLNESEGESHLLRQRRPDPAKLDELSGFAIILYMENKKKVLIVEDDTVLANAITMSLENEGYDLLVATDGEEAEKMISKNMPDLVLLDLLLPIKNGFEVLKTMRENEATKNITVVVLTNFEQETSVDEAVKLGAKDYIVKANIDIKEIPRIVKKNLFG